MFWGNKLLAASNTTMNPWRGNLKRKGLHLTAGLYTQTMIQGVNFAQFLVLQQKWMTS